MKDHRIGCNTLYPDVNERKTGGWTFSPQKIMDALKKLSEIGYTDTEYSHIYHLSYRRLCNLTSPVLYPCVDRSADLDHVREHRFFWG